MKILTPKDDIFSLGTDNSFKVFLAGGMKKPWRKELIDALENLDINLTIIDPTVEDWENDVGEESVDNPKYVKQTTWEHIGLEKSDIQIFHFDGSTLSPITLCEMCLFMNTNSIVQLEDDYEKAGYVRYVASRNGVPVVKTPKEVVGLITIRFHTGS